MDRPDPPLRKAADPNRVKTQPNQQTQPQSEGSQESQDFGGVGQGAPAAAGTGEEERTTPALSEPIAPAETAVEGHVGSDEAISEEVAGPSPRDAAASEDSPPPSEFIASEDMSPEATAPEDQDTWSDDARQVPCVALPSDELTEPAVVDPPVREPSASEPADSEPLAPGETTSEVAERASPTLADLSFRDIKASEAEAEPAFLQPPGPAGVRADEASDRHDAAPPEPEPEPEAHDAPAKPPAEPASEPLSSDAEPMREKAVETPPQPSEPAADLQASEAAASRGEPEANAVLEPPAHYEITREAEPAEEAEPEPEPRPEPEAAPERPSLAAIVARQEAAARAPAAPQPRETTSNEPAAASSVSAAAPAAWTRLAVSRDDAQKHAPPAQQFEPLAERWNWGRLKPYGIRAAKVAAITFSAWFTVVICLIVVYRFVNPPFSALMAMQWVTGTTIKQQWAPIERISPNLVRAVIASEDGRFCRHWGIDFAEIADAIRRSSGGVPRGASTITMQVAKNLFLWPSKSYVRKVIEVPLTYAIELFWTKRRILEVYLNIAEWGPGVFGAEAAAKADFGRSAARLSARQGALLAVALPNPFTRDAGDPGPWASRRASVIQRRAARSPELAACILGKD